MGIIVKCSLQLCREAVTTQLLLQQLGCLTPQQTSLAWLHLRMCLKWQLLPTSWWCSRWVKVGPLLHSAPQRTTLLSCPGNQKHWVSGSWPGQLCE